MAPSPEPGTFLALLSDHDRYALLQLGKSRSFARGDRLMQQGEPGDRVIVLLDGRVKASSVDAGGNEVVLDFRGPGDILGELTFLHAEPRSSSVTAIESVHALAVSGTGFRVYLERTPSAALTVIDVISRRVRSANRARMQFLDLDTIGRLAARLVELSHRYGVRTDRGIEIALPITQGDLGGWTASSRAAVAGALRTMRELDWIETERRQITVLDYNALVRRST